MFFLFFVLFLCFRLFKKKMDMRVGGWHLTNPSFSRFFLNFSLFCYCFVLLCITHIVRLVQLVVL